MSKILMLVEGAKTDIRLMAKLLDMYGISDDHKLVSYNTNIYELYREMFDGGDPDSMDLLQLLKEREPDEEKKKIFDERYSDILLIFDLDPHDHLFAEYKIIEMAEYFNESSDMGKLYINYPMVEAFYHMKDIPDSDYMSYTVTMDELKAGTYKQRVNRENRNHDYGKFAADKDECNIVIKQNIEKAYKIIEKECNYTEVPDSGDILRNQLQKLKDTDEVFVLCTCDFYIADYNPQFLL